MTKLNDIITAAAQKADVLKAAIDTNTAEIATLTADNEAKAAQKAAFDKMIAESQALSPDTVAVLDSLTDELTAASQA